MSDGIKLFYSYAHEDDGLRQELDKQLTILERAGIIERWHDRNIKAGSEWKTSIDAHLRSADIILLLVSPDFISSEYCYGVELDLAMARHERHEAVVIPIILRPVHWKKAAFSKLQALPTDGMAVTIWPQGRDAAFAVVSERIEEVANEILGKQKSPLRTTKPAVYLAETTNDRRMQGFRNGIADELAAHGYPVVPAEDIDLPDESPHYQNQIRQYLESVKFSIHPIGNTYGRSIAGANDKSVVELQNSLAQELREQGRLESLIWIPPDAKPQGDRQIAFQTYLETDSRAQLKAELSRRPFQSVKDQIIEKLGKYDRSRCSPQSTNKSVYLMCEQRDKQLVAEIKDFIHSHGFEVFLPPSVIDQGPAASFHERCLTSCDATLIYYGEPNDDWVKVMILDIITFPKLRPSGDFLCKALFLAGSADYQTHAAEKLKYDGLSVATSLKPFIECLQRKSPNGGQLQ